VVLDLEKILKSNCFQETLIGFKRLTKLDLYVALNKLVAYNAFNERKIAV
jgi:hypothetical protein